MAGETTITIIGNLTADPDTRELQSGHRVASFNIASTPRLFKDGEWRDGETFYLRATCWRDLADRAVEALSKGTKVIATGKLKQRTFTGKDGERTVIELDVDELGVSIRKGATGRGKAAPAAVRPPAAPGPTTDPWDAETPF